MFFLSVVAWSYYAYFVAVVLNAMAPSPAEQVPIPIIISRNEPFPGDLCYRIPLPDRPVRLVLRHGNIHTTRLRTSLMASQP